jgi:hypothetical protein
MMRLLRLLPVAASACAFALSSAAHAGVVWRLAGGTTSVSLLNGVLKDQGIQVTGLRQTSRETAQMESPIGFRVLEASSLKVTTSQRVLDLINGGSVGHSGGFSLRIGKSTYPVYDFEIAPKGNVPQQGFVLRSPGKGGATFDLSHAQAFLDSGVGALFLANMDMTVNASWAKNIGRPDLAGLLIGVVTVQGKAEWVSGEEKPNPGPGIGGDTIDVGLSAMSSLTSLGRLGTFPNGTNGLSMSTTSCNYGTENLPWYQAMDERHPVICMNLYRVMNDRFEQIGVGWLKHGFFATNSGGCGTCQSPGTGSLLGPGCSDTYGTGNNGDRFWLGPRNEVNPFTGRWTCTGSWFSNYINDCVRRNGSGSFNPVEHRLEVRDADLNVTGAQFYYEAYYIVQNDINKYNQIGYRQATPTWNGSSWSISTNTAMTTGPAINLYGDMRDTAMPRTFGDAILAVKTIDLGGGNWRYEYALYVHDIDRQIREFSIAIDPATTVTNVGFRDIDQDPNNNWTSNWSNGRLSWSTQTFQQNPNANSLKYGSVFNFWFTANAAPVNSCANIGLFKPDTVMLLSADTKAPPMGAIRPDSWMLVGGQYGGGDVASLYARDGNRLLIQIVDELNVTDAVYDVFGTSPCPDPSAIRLNLTSQTDRPPSLQFVQLWNFTTNAWETIDTRTAPTTETQIQVSVTSNAARFVGVNNQMRARVTHMLIQDEAQTRVWNSWFDETTWTVTP